MSVINDPFTWLAKLIEEWMRSSLNMPEVGVLVTMMVLRAGCLCVFGLVMFMAMTWIERKGVARIQNRIGPNLAGPWGLLQPIADGIKALTKEDITPAQADRVAYNAAPILAAVAAMLVFAVIPFGPGLIGADINIGVFYILAVSGLGVIAILMAGWSSNNKYALLGGFRVVAQLVSYEVPHVLSIVTVVMLAGSMSMIEIVNRQPVWFIVALPVSALVALLSGMAEIGRSPFDLLDAESEIIAGHHIEYSGMKFALFFLAEYVHAFAVSCVVTALFLGGWRNPSPLVSAIGVLLVWVVLLIISAAARPLRAESEPGYGGVILTVTVLGVLLILFSALSVVGLTVPWLWFLIKAILVFNVMVWARGTLPRLRIDHLMAFNWKFLVPISLANLIVVSLADRLARALGLGIGTWAWSLVLLVFNVALVIVALALVGMSGRRARLAAEPQAESTAQPHQEPAAVGVH